VLALPLADGPAMYLGSSIMTFALPFGAFIAAAVALYFLFRVRHSGPRLRYLTSGHQVASVTTREPGPASSPPVLAAAPDAPETTVAPGTLPPETASTETDGGQA
jgi:hypothetical protein